MVLSENVGKTPKNPMVLLIIIPFLKMAISLGVWTPFSDIPRWGWVDESMVQLSKPWCKNWELGLRTGPSPKNVSNFSTARHSYKRFEAQKLKTNGFFWILQEFWMFFFFF